MNAEEFAIFFRELIGKDMTAFVANMEKLGVTDKKPHEWAEMLIKWLELGSEEDARYSYKRYYE